MSRLGKIFFTAWVVYLLGITGGCSSKPYRAYDDASLTSQQILAMLMHDREHQVSSLFGGSSSHITDSGSGFGSNRVQVYDTPSRVAEYHLIEDRHDARHLQNDPLLLMPLFGNRDPHVALTALHIYEKAWTRTKRDYSDRPHRETGEKVIRPEDHALLGPAIAEACRRHPDQRVRMHAAWFLMSRGEYTPKDLEAWLSDRSDDVRLAVAFCLQIDRYPKRMKLKKDDYNLPHQRAHVASDLASVVVKHLDDTDIHTANALMTAYTEILGHYGKFDALFEVDAPDFRALKPKWIYLSWQERRDQTQAIQTWWDKTGKQDYT
ncbi:MAG: HEAT repeat domain-containing protein [Planctomycetota bacterium]